jgi:hypothetical protein
MIDEIQRVPELLLAIKREVDRDPRSGRFLLTGSARPVQLCHYRDRDQVEADMVLGHAAGTVIGIEVRPARLSEPRISAACATWRAGLASASGRGSCSTAESSSSPSATG